MTGLVETPEEPGTIQKLVSGRWGDFNALDGIDLTRQVAIFLPGGNLADVSLAGVSGSMGADAEQRRLESQLGVQDLRSQALRARSRVLKGKVEEWDAATGDNFGAAVTGTAGSIPLGALGAMLGSMILPVAGTLIGGGVGAIAGTMGGEAVYRAIMGGKSDDTLNLLAKIYLTQQAAFERNEKADIPPEAVFAMLVSNLPEADRNRIAKELEKKTGAKSFNEAISTEEGAAALRGMMKRGDIDDLICAHTGLRCHVAQAMTATEQITMRLNDGTMNAQELLLNRHDLTALEIALQGSALTGSGVGVSPEGELISLPPTSGGRTRTT